MRKVYECEICFKTYAIRNQAIKCEKQGIFNTEKFIEPGFIFPYFAGDKYLGMACINKNSARIDELNRHQGYMVYDVCNPKANYFIGMIKGDHVLNFNDDAIRRFTRTRKTNRIYLQEKECLMLVESLKKEGINPYYLADNGKITYL